MASFRFDNTLNTKLGMFTWMMSYITKGHEENQYLYKPMFCTNVSVYKAFLKNRLSFQLFIYDLFGTNDSHMIAHFGKMKEWCMMDCQQAKFRLLYDISSTLQEASIRVQVQEKARRTECNLSAASDNGVMTINLSINEQPNKIVD